MLPTKGQSVAQCQYGDSTIFLLFWADKRKRATLIYPRIFLEVYSEPCQTSNRAFCENV